MFNPVCANFMTPAVLTNYENRSYQQPHASLDSLAICTNDRFDVPETILLVNTGK